MKFNFLFEMTSAGAYVGVLQNSALVSGKIASQDAGSSDYPIYYQVGGGNVNGYFHDALVIQPSDTTLVDSVNKALVAAYDQRFGKDAWNQDRGRDDRLTSFYIPLPANAHSVSTSVGSHVAGMIYSVGPKISGSKIPDRDVYRQIYIDAFNEVAANNKNASAKDKIEAIRLTMISTGIYSTGGDVTALASEAAGLILEGLEAAAAGADAAYLPATMLINNKKSSNKEKDAFSSAAKARNVQVDSRGFTLDLTGQANFDTATV